MLSLGFPCFGLSHEGDASPALPHTDMQGVTRTGLSFFSESCPMASEAAKRAQEDPNSLKNQQKAPGTDIPKYQPK